MARRIWLPAATLLILPVLAFGYGRLGGFDRSSNPGPGSPPEPGWTQRSEAAPDDRVDCPVCLAEGRSAETKRSNSITHVHEGRRYQLCSGGCLQQFKKNPAYFLAALAERLRGPGSEAEPEQEM